MHTSIIEHGIRKSAMGILGAMTIAATLVFPPLAASAHEWEAGRKGPPYGWAKGHYKQKDKDKHKRHEHEWRHQRTRHWDYHAAERKHRDYHRQRRDVIYRDRHDRWHREQDLNRRRARQEVRLKQEQLNRDIEELKRDRRELRHDIRNGANRAETRRDRQEIREDRQKIAAGRQELRRAQARLDAAGRHSKPNSGF